MKQKIIEDPAAWLAERYGENIQKQVEVSFGIGRLCQKSYEKGKKGQAIGNCTLSSLCNALDWERKHGYDQIPAPPQARYRLVRQEKKFWMGTLWGGMPVYDNATLCRRVWRQAGYPAIHSKSHYFCSVSDAIRLAQGGRPFLLSMFFGRYRRHTVAVDGYAIYTRGNEIFRFLRIQDNWCSVPRYLAEGETIWGVITRWEE